MKTEHTDLPWRVGGAQIRCDSLRIEDSKGVGLLRVTPAGYPYVTLAEDAHFIVRACNAHDDLLAACSAALVSEISHSFNDFIPGRRDDIVEQLKKAIAKAEGRAP